MKYTDNILMIAAAYSLYTLSVIFSTQYFAGINQLIPDIFSGRAHINISSTFHLVIGSIVTAMLLVRFAPKPIMIAFLVAIAVNLESYILLLDKYSIDASIDYYLSHPSAILNLLKPLILLPVITYLAGLIKRFEPPQSDGSNSN